MRKGQNKIYIALIWWVLFVLANFSVKAQGLGFNNDPDTTKIKFPVSRQENPYDEPDKSPMYLEDPSNIKDHVEYNPETNEYEVSRKMGNLYYSPPVTMSIGEYTEYQHRQALRRYWYQRSTGKTTDNRSSFIPQLTVGGETFDKIFGSNTVNIVPQGSAELIFGFNLSRIDNPQQSEKLRKTPSFTFEERIQMNVTGTIGDKVELGINYNTEATFDFENKTKLEYSGKEDEIIKKIEAGNVTLPLTGSLITGSQSLFGFKTELQFGKMYVTTVISQQRGETSSIQMEGGAQMNDYEVEVIDYDANKHFFLSQYFRDNYEKALSKLPVISSDITITKIEIWVTNKADQYENQRNILAVTDLAENVDSNIYHNDYFSETINNDYPCNGANNAYDLIKRLPNVRDLNNTISVLNNEFEDFNLGQDFEKLENARLLTSSEYKIHPNLGYISLNGALNADEVLAVAYEFTAGGRTYKVGELSTDGIASPSMLIVKLIKGTSLSPNYKPTWDLMMKNVYAIGAYQINPEDFELNILYQDDKTGTAIPYIKEGAIQKELLLKVMNLDRVNSQGDPQPDGVFDYFDGITLYSSNGRIFFPSLEPFGSYLRNKITNGNLQDKQLNTIADKYVYDELYSETQTVARQKAEKNKFILEGRYQSSSSNEIMLNAMNIPNGSVKVTAGGRQLVENEDYTVDYALGRVKIINQGLLESGTPINVSLENNSLFNIQTKTMIGTNINYRFSDNFVLGGTVLRLTERPLTKKVNIGEEPISNTIWGLNGSYTTESQMLTTWIDKLPLIETKETSKITMDGEFAQLIPGQSKTIGKNGVAYIDDFEGAETSYDMRTPFSWKLASVPQHQEGMFPEAETDGLTSGFNRAKIAWYTIDPVLQGSVSQTPDYMKDNDEYQKGHYVRKVREEEIFPEKDRSTSEPSTISVLNIAYYPDEKGPYNFVVEDTSITNGYIYGMNEEGNLTEPETRWGGVMRDIQTNDFEAANVEFIEFWLMDPFVENTNHHGGRLYFNLGDISEDVLKDSRKSFENGLPATDEVKNITETVWARIPTQQINTEAFDVDATNREYQDVGLDGVRNEREVDFYSSYIARVRSVFSNNLANSIADDPSNDNYHYYRGSDYDNQRLDILERYKYYNNPEGNSPTDEQSPEDYSTSATFIPDAEDINDDNTLNEGENYYQYVVDLNPDELNANNPYITNIIESSVTDPQGRSVNWYQFKIPINEYDNSYGSIDGFKSIRFMRMFLKGWEEDVVLRFARLELVRSEWRKYEQPIEQANEATTEQNPNTRFEILSVNIEENSSKEPVNYILPPGIDRAIDPSNPQLQQLNEQSIVLRAIDLGDGDARAAFKTINMDMRQYTRLIMNVHAEEIYGYPLEDNEITAFIRLGSDYKNNFYEYEIPLVLTPEGNYYKAGLYTDEDRLIVWPDENLVDIDMEIFTRAKQARNDEKRQTGSGVDLTTFYQYQEEDEKALITVVGNPSLSDVKVIMIGIRNSGDHGINGSSNDGLSKSVEVWMNELRLTDFRDKGGWAANARVQAKLADLGTVAVAGSTLKPGFGSIEKKVNERSKEEVNQYDISTNLQLGKLFPEKAKVSIPMYIGFSEQIINPEYNSLDEDIPLQAALDLAKTKEERDSIILYNQDRTTRRSINFTNVKVNQAGKKPMPWDPANFSVSYSYNEIKKRDVETQYDWEFNHRGSFNYMYNLRPKNVKPLSKIKFLKSKQLQLIRDFNFYYLPSKISYRTDVDRHYSETKKRNLTEYDFDIDATSERDFLWNWYFDMKFDLSRSLKFDYSASNMARFDEENYLLKEQSDEDSLYTAWRKALIREIENLGRPTLFNHKINAQYTVPINKIPLFNWTSLTARYSATYDWKGGSRDENDEYLVGHTIQNSRNIQFNNNNNLVNLYNKVGYLKKVNQETSGKGKPKVKETKTVTYEDENVNLYAGKRKTIEHRLKTEKIKVKVLDPEGKEIPVQLSIIDQNKIRITSDTDYRDAKIIVEGEVQKGANPIELITKNTTRTLMSVRSINISYSTKQATALPGYSYLNSFTSMIDQPGWGYITAISSEEDIRKKALQDNWFISNIDDVNNPFTIAYAKTLNVRSEIEPFRDFKISVDGSWNESKNFEEYLYYGNNGVDFMPDTRIETGNISISTITLMSAFEKYDSANISKVFETFKDNRLIIANRLLEERNRFRTVNSPEYVNDSNSVYYRPDPNITDEYGFPETYGPTSQQVLIPAFLAAYTGKDASKIRLNPMIRMTDILPNWRITYDGLSKIDFIKKYFRTVSLSHSYRSTYSISSYRNNPYYIADTADNLNYELDNQGNYWPQYEIGSVTIVEQLSPLIGIDMNWVNSMTTRFEIKKSRNLNLSMSNNQLTEMRSNEIVVGVGYRFKDVQLFINQRTYKSDINVRTDLSVRDNINYIRSLALNEENEYNQPTSGQRVITVKLNADYVLNDRFNLRFFFDRVVNNPYVTRTFPTANTNVGFSITFTLTQ